LKHWVDLSIPDLAVLFRRTSKWAKSAHIAYWYLQELKALPRLPSSIPELTRVYGIQKKSAVLILQNVYTRQFGIPVDRHLAWAFLNLGWVATGNNKPNPLIMSYMVESWIPIGEWALANDVIAGLRQLCQSSSTRSAFKEILCNECSETERTLITTLCK
jgi:endonuclease III